MGRPRTQNKYRIVGDHVEIELESKRYPGLTAYCDVLDWKYLIDYKWHPKWNEKCKTYYLECFYETQDREDKTKRKKQINKKMHIMVMIPNGMDVNHIDFNGLNNRRSNLELRTASENSQYRRMRSDNESGLKGVGWCKREKKWVARIGLNRKLISLGYYTNKIEAGFVYDAAVKLLFMEPWILNFPGQQIPSYIMDKVSKRLAKYRKSP